MSYTPIHRVLPALNPDDLAVVARVFERVCADCNEPTSTSVAARCAGTLIRSFQRGIAEEEMLLDIGHAVLRS